MTFVIIAYNNQDEVKDFIYKQLFKQTYRDIKVYVVVNAGSFEFEPHEKVTVLHPGKNVGYMGSLRYVIETAKPAFDFITLCNTDLSFENAHFLADYVNELKKKEFAIAGPRIFSALTQTDQNPLCAERQPKRKVQTQEFFYGNTFLYSIYQYLFYLKRRFSKHLAVLFVENPYALHGSFFTLSKKYFEKGGTLNYPVLMYGEELFLAEEAIKVGLKNLFVSNLKIVHYDHATTGKYNFKQVAFMKEAMSFILKNYYK